MAVIPAYEYCSLLLLVDVGVSLLAAVAVAVFFFFVPVPGLGGFGETIISSAVSDGSLVSTVSSACDEVRRLLLLAGVGLGPPSAFGGMISIRDSEI